MYQPMDIWVVSSLALLSIRLPCALCRCRFFILFVCGIEILSHLNAIRVLLRLLLFKLNNQELINYLQQLEDLGLP